MLLDFFWRSPVFLFSDLDLLFQGHTFAFYFIFRYLVNGDKQYNYCMTANKILTYLAETPGLNKQFFFIHLVTCSLPVSFAVEKILILQKPCLFYDVISL